MLLVSSPVGVNFSGNLPKIVVSANVGEVVTAILKKNGVVILEETYNPNAAGLIDIDYKAIIEGLLKIEVPTFQSTIFNQLNGIALFEVNLSSSLGGNTTFNFRAVKGGVDAQLVDQSSFFQGNFLTWQPQTKEVKSHDPEFLTYYCQYASKVVVKGYLADGNSQLIDLVNLADNTLVTVNVNYGQISALINGVVYYDVWVQQGSDRISYIQRYILSNQNFEFDNVFLFENTLGGLDTIRLTGELEEKNISEFSTAAFDDIVLDYDVKVEKSYTINSGYLKSERNLQWSSEFIVSLQKYYLSNGTLTRIFSNKPEITSVKGELPSFEIDFVLSKQTKYRNLNRNDQPLPNLQIDTQLGEVFFLAPRLNEFPWANDDDALIPVQYPYEDKWRKISLLELIERATPNVQIPKVPRTLFRTSPTAVEPPPLDQSELNPLGWTSAQPENSGGGELITVEGGFVVEIDTKLLTTNLNNKWIWSIREEFNSNGSFRKWSKPLRITPIDGLNPEFQEVRFKKNGSAILPPELNRNEYEPEGWSLDVPELGVLDYLWKIYGRKRLNPEPELVDLWSLPILDTSLIGPPGIPGVKGNDAYAVTLSADNMVVKAALDGTVTPEELALARTFVTATRGTTTLTSKETGVPGVGQYSLSVQSVVGGTVGFINFKSGVVLGTMTAEVAYVSLIINVENLVTFNKIFKVTKSKNGEAGTPGIPSYLHIRYSNDNGITFTPDGGTSTGDYLGQLSNSNPIASTNPAHYVWKRIVGKTGPLPSGGDVYDPNRYYYGNDTQVNIVRYNDGTGTRTYVTRSDAGEFKNIPPTNNSKWNVFTGEWDMVATKLFFAQLSLIEKAVVENLWTGIAPHARFEILQSQNNISHFEEFNKKIGEWSANSALSDDYYTIDIQANLPNFYFFNDLRTQNYSGYNSGSWNSKKQAEDNFALGFPRGYTGVKYFVGGSSYRYYFRDTTAGLKIGNPDDDYSLFGATTVGRHLVSSDSIVSKGAFATGLKTITGDYIVDTPGGFSNGRDHTLLYRGSANIVVKLPLPVENSYSLPDPNLMRNLNLGREIKIQNKSAYIITAWAAGFDKIVVDSSGTLHSYGIAPNTTAIFKLFADGDNPLSLSTYKWVLD